MVIKTLKKTVLMLPMLAFPSYALEVSTQSDCQFAAERTKLTGGNTRNLLVLYVVSRTCYLDMSFFLSVASVSNDQPCLLENWKLIYHISILVCLGKACVQAFLLLNYYRDSVQSHL